MKVIPFPHGKNPWRVVLPASYSADGKRKTHYFKTKEDGELFLRKLKRNGPGMLSDAPAISQTSKDRFQAAVLWAADELGGNVAEIYAAIKHWKTRMDLKPATVREAVDAFQAYRKTKVDAGELSPKTLRADGSRLLNLVNEFSEIQLVNLTTAALLEFFDKLECDKRSVFKSVRVFLAWAIQRRYLVENPVATIEADDVGKFGVNNEFYPVETFRRMLRIAAGLDPVNPGEEPTKDFVGLLPWFVLSGFAGVRTCEAVRGDEKGADAVRWSDLYFDLDIPQILIRKEIAKTDKPRYIETSHYVLAVRSWLSLIPMDGAQIVGRNEGQMNDLKRAFEARTGIKFLANGFRNSFATYSLTFDGMRGVGKLAIEMGNSEAVAGRHYIQHIAPGTGRAWFNLRPFEVVSGAAAMA